MTMALAPKFRSFRLDAVAAPADVQPDVAQSLTNSSMTQNEMVHALSRGLTRRDNFAGTEKLNALFTTQASGAMTCRIAHGMASNPKHRVCTNLERVDGTALAVWSCNSVLQSGGFVLFTWQGLVASTQYRASFTFD